MAGINIAFVADVTDFLRGGEKAEDAIEDVGGALDDLARDATKQGKATGDAIEKGVESGTKDAADAVEKLERSFADMARDASKYGKQAGSDLGDNVKRGTQDAEGGLESFRDEAASTARETAASFDGSADSIAGSFQEVAANALAGFGPIGAAAGLALAAGIGVFWQNHQKNTEKAAEQVQTMFDDMISSQQAFLSQSFLEEEYYKIIKGADDAALSQKQLQEAVSQTGLTEAQVARLFVQSGETRAQLQDILRQKMEENRRISEGVGSAGDAQRLDERKDMAELIALLDDYGGRVQATSEKYRDAAREGRVFTDNAIDGAARARAEYDGLGRKISELPTERTVTVRVQADTRDAERAVRRFTDGSYQVTVKGQVTGMRIV